VNTEHDEAERRQWPADENLSRKKLRLCQVVHKQDEEAEIQLCAEIYQ